MCPRKDSNELLPAWRQPTGEKMLVDSRALDGLLEEAAQSSPREILRTATREITSLLGQRGSFIVLGRRPRVVFALHRPSVSDLPIDLDRYPEVLAAAETCHLVAVTDVRRDAMLASVRAHLPQDLQSVFAVPLVVRRRCLGVALVQSSRAEQVDDVARMTASLLARMAALLVLPQLEHEAGTAGPEMQRGTGERSKSAGADSRDGAGRILVVEDDGPTATALASALLDEGYLVDVAPDGHECLGRAAEGGT